MPLASGPETPLVSVVVPNWNGARFLNGLLDSLQAAIDVMPQPTELIVVDDASEDDSVERIRRGWPWVRLFVNRRNLRFAETSNRGARESRGRVLVMLNNDVVVPPDFLRILTASFFAPPEAGARPLFAVGAKTVDAATGAPNHLCMRPAWRRGGLGKEWSDPAERCETAYVQGGAAAYSREVFLALGGFEPLFAPGYWEDYDLSYRAARGGLRCLYEPAAVARHVGKGSLAPLLGEKPLARLDERNRLWFNWLNLDADGLLVRHLAAVPWVCARDAVRGRAALACGPLLDALRGIGPVLALRRRRRAPDGDPPPALSNREMTGADGPGGGAA